MRRVLVANRGEIALRVIRACADEGVRTVLAVSEADRDSLPARTADQVVVIGPASAARSYLSVGAVVSAALLTGCDALHPGYGFLSERPELAEACARAGVTFVGPPAAAIRRGGDKIAARDLARSLGIPVGGPPPPQDRVDLAVVAPDEPPQNRADPGTTTARSTQVGGLAGLAAQAAAVGYPVLLKAAAGGGGRGMRRVDGPDALAGAAAQASAEASAAFGDSRLYVEPFVTAARHVEVQVLADTHGTVIHLGDRDCSYQRRYQKLVEEAPAGAVPEPLRTAIAGAAVALLRALDYVGAGTVEFLVDIRRGTFLFLEVNTRVQVEHPVTELVTGVDIVREQLRVAAGEPLSVRQEDVRISGHAIEFRINAEGPDFIPVPGTITEWVPPPGSAVRVDTHCHTGYTVPPYYDSLLAKLICHGADRPAALAVATRALDAFRVGGIPTTLPMHRRLVRHPDVHADRVTTRWVEETFLADTRGVVA